MLRRIVVGLAVGVLSATTVFRSGRGTRAASGTKSLCLSRRCRSDPELRQSRQDGRLRDDLGESERGAGEE